MRATGKPKQRKAKNNRAGMPPSVAVFHVAIRSLAEFVFPFFPLSKSQRRQLAKTSALYTFGEEIRQSFFCLAQPQKSHDSQFPLDKTEQGKGGILNL